MVTLIFLSLNLAAAPITNAKSLEVKSVEQHLSRFGVTQEYTNYLIGAAKEYKVDVMLLTKIMLLESMGKLQAVNKRTSDYGLMQINKSTAKLYNINSNCFFNAKCNIYAGAMILSDLSRYKKYRPCMYNLGPRVLKGDRLKKCLSYERKLDKFN